MNQQTDFDKALKDPTLVYHSPREVLVDQQLNDEQRAQILKRWEQDARELDVAQEEGMTGGENSLLDEILDAMEMLGVDLTSAEAPTKQGGPIE
ncbi:hypothetical protein [Thiohalophilus sp.]|uniref:hypothetical protein n=1 Tax=Thiohalophilus sp. TaxID=3028392 RepID=UPI002ACE87D6|nr:hypothetical protein [Thiohalophilus sp.]MDZ7662941.1 hypothetical protein [Thiohalophilus sp.]